MMAGPLTITFITSLVSTFLVAVLFAFIVPASLSQALTIALALWLGFVGVVDLDTVMWENRSWQYFFITTGCRLLNLLLIATILYYWK